MKPGVGQTLSFSSSLSFDGMTLRHSPTVAFADIKKSMRPGSLLQQYFIQKE